MNLPRLKNSEYEQAERLAAMSGQSLDECPTCHSKPVDIGEDVHVYQHGTYRFRGEEHKCDCDTQRLLYKHYLVANIPTQYQRLNWNDYVGSDDVVNAVAAFLDNWSSFKDNGMGLEFYGTKLGTGKTFAATSVGKELVKKGEKVYFKDFKEILSAYEAPDREAVEERLRTTTVLILDEVIPPWTDKQKGFFNLKFEELIRHRTNFNLPTIMTTNLEPDTLHEIYPRTYSLLEAKQQRIKLTGEDARRERIAVENLELVMNNETRPIF